MTKALDRSRRWIVGAALALSLVLSMFVPDAVMPRAGGERADRMMAQLTRLAGLSGDSRATLPVRVNQEGGPLWVTEATEAAVESQSALQLQSTAVAIVRVEVVSDDEHLALRGSLYRQGWNLRTEHPLRVRTTPWMPMLALGLGFGAMLLSRRMGIGLLVAGGFGQLIDRVVAWPDAFVSVPWSAAVSDGPLGASVIDLALSLPDSAVAVGAGIVTLCTILVAFDHKRSAGRGGTLLAAGLLGFAGVVIWAEAAARGGMMAWIGTPVGAVSILAMAVAWGQQGRTLRRA